MKSSVKHILLPSAYLPPIAYFSLILKSEVVVIEQFETYPKQTFRNRCQILTGNGRLNLTIPVSKPFGNRTKTKEVMISDAEKWQLNHWRAIQSAYLNSPFFEYYQDDLEPFYSRSFEGLVDFNIQLLRTINKIIGLEKDLLFTSSFEKKPENVLDLRLSIHPKKEIGHEFFPHYIQVFSDKHTFTPNLSIIDLLFNLGPETSDYLTKLDVDKMLFNSQ